MQIDTICMSMAALLVKQTLPWPYGWLKTCIKSCLILQKCSKIYCQLKKAVTCNHNLDKLQRKRVFHLRQLILEFLDSQDRILSMVGHKLDHVGEDAQLCSSISWFLPKASQDATQTRMTWATQEVQLWRERNTKFQLTNLENFEVWSETRQSAIMAGRSLYSLGLSGSNLLRENGGALADKDAPVKHIMAG